MKQRILNYLERFKNKKILIQGLGLNGGGVETARFFLENNIPVIITDLKKKEDLIKSIEKLSKYEDKITYILGEHREIDFINADIIVKGPGVPPTNKYIQIAINNNKEIISDIEIFCHNAPCPIYAITGSKGKSTTTSLIYHIFKYTDKNTFIGGNITISPLTFINELNEKSLVILELSSWQLRDIKNKNIRFHGAGITNLLKDHQNYYSNMIDYLQDKIVITENQQCNDFLIIPYNDKFINLDNFKTKAQVYTISFDDKNSDFYFYDNKAYFRDKILFDIDDIKIIGEKTKINFLFAAGFCYLAGIDILKIKKGIQTFNGVPYRLQLIREWNGIKFINDTTATIPEASINALLSFKEPIIWIAGGTDKNIDFSILSSYTHIPKKILLLPGNGTEKMKQILNRNDIIEGASLEELFNIAISLAEKGDIILLSPGCASFGLFQNEFHRGDVFNQLVNKLT